MLSSSYWIGEKWKIISIFNHFLLQFIGDWFFEFNQALLSLIYIEDSTILYLIGWMPLSIKASACSRRAPHKTTTPVVPSPISSSCDWDSCTINLAIYTFRMKKKLLVPIFLPEMINRPIHFFQYLFCYHVIS